MSNEDDLQIGMLTGADVICISADASLVEVASALTDAGVGALVVGSIDAVSGVISERDIVRAVAEGKDLAAVSAGDVASTELVWAATDAAIGEVALEMSDQWVRHVLVEERGQLVGIVSSRDLLGAYASNDAAD